MCQAGRGRAGDRAQHDRVSTSRAANRLPSPAGRAAAWRLGERWNGSLTGGFHGTTGWSAWPAAGRELRLQLLLLGRKLPLPLPGGGELVHLLRPGRRHRRRVPE